MTAQEFDTDDALMARAKAGDQPAFCQLVQRHEGAVRRYCHAVLGDRAQAWDAAQEVFLRVWAARDRYEGRAMFKAFLFTVAKNVCRKAKQRRWLQPWTRDAMHETADGVAPNAHMLMEQQQTNRLLERGLLSLPEKFRVPLILRFMDELDYQAIALVIGRTESAARSRVFYGLQLLAAKLPEEVNL